MQVYAKKYGMVIIVPIYEKEQAAAAAPGSDAGADKDDDVVDAEFSEVDENNKA